MTRWKRRIKIKDLLDGDDSPEEVVRIAAVVVERLRKDTPSGRDADLDFVVSEFEDITAEDKKPVLLFDDALDQLYDWADYNRVWIE